PTRGWGVEPSTLGEDGSEGIRACLAHRRIDFVPLRAQAEPPSRAVRSGILRRVAGITIAAIAPHGGIAVAELCADGELELALATRAGLEELGRRFAAASPDAAFVLTPHNVHVEGSFAVIVAGSLEGTVREGTRTIELTCPVDVDLALGALRGLAAAGLPVTGVSYGGNRPAE